MTSPGVSYQVRVAGAADVSQLVQLANSAYRGESSKAGWTTEEHLLDGVRVTEDELLEIIQPPDQKIILLEGTAKAVVGCVYLKRESAEMCYVGLLAVSPTLQGAGLGKILLQESEKAGQDWNCKQIRMNVISLRDELISYYERRGYQRSGREEEFPNDLPKIILKQGRLVLIELVKTFRCPTPF